LQIIYIKLDGIYDEIKQNKFYYEPYDWLLSRKSEEIQPHAYNTISLGLLNTDNDGLLRKIDTVIDHEKHMYFNWSSRFTPYLDIYIKF
jgi:hypothetical protein